jgi:hypothetical protein
MANNIIGLSLVYSSSGLKLGCVWKSNADPNINVLNSNSMACCAPPGPGVSIRTSCSYNTAIWLCNDVSFTTIVYRLPYLILPSLTYHIFTNEGFYLKRV